MTIAPTKLEQLSTEMRSAFMQLQRNVVRLALLGLFAAALLIVTTIQNQPNFMWALATSLLLILLIPLVWFLSRVTFIGASLLLDLSLFGAVFSAVLLGKMEGVIYLLFLPVGFFALAFGIESGALLGVATSLVLLIAPGPLQSISLEAREGSLLGVWGALGLIWLTLRPLLSSAEWSWEAFRRSQILLEEARESQSKLRQALEDLTNANTQLSALNILANNLRRAAEDERRIKEQFVANVSHELRTPLNMIIGFCEMMLRNPEAYGGQVPPSLLADLQIVLRNSQHLSGLVDDVLDLSQIETHQMSLVKEWVSINEVVEAAVIAVRPLYGSKNLFLELDVQPDLPRVSCDCIRIREVLLNLLSNAGRFTDVGGVRVHVWQDSAFIMFSVEDTGPGISEEDKSKLFQPFQQLDATIRRLHGGTGLGLNISKSFVELHDGKMWVESKKGVGTTFFFRLPLDLPALSKAAYTRWVNPFNPYIEKSTRVPVLPVADKRPRVMVVDKGGVFLHLVKRYLGDVVLLTAPDLESARTEIVRNPVQMVLVNNPDVCNTIEELSSTIAFSDNIPAIACSIADPTRYATYPEVGEILVKPISYDLLTNALDKLNIPLKTVLIVDDEPDAQKLFHRMITAMGKGSQVLRAENGLQALEILRRSKVDAILLDLIMPEMDGFAFLKIKDQDPDIKDIPVILISAQDQRGHPIVSNFLVATRSGGISVQQLLDAIKGLAGVLGS